MSNNKSKLLLGTGILAGIFIVLQTIGKKKNVSQIDENNPYIKSAESEQKDRSVSYYEKCIKPFIDKTLSFACLVALAPVFGILSLAIFIDDPGPVLFTQKRVGKDKHFFSLHKFRSMKMSTPHDVPTHQLTNPDQYITRVGKFIRKKSIDELPQIWDIFVGNMSIIGPRPALWNQEDLVEERDRYDVNSIMPGLTGWAQINGRDELEISEKAALDGEYVQKLRKGGINALLFDIKCILGTIKSVSESKGVVEGGTGELAKQRKSNTTNSNDKDFKRSKSDGENS